MSRPEERPQRIIDAILHAVRMYPAAHDVYSPEELEAVLEAHRRRILANAPTPVKSAATANRVTVVPDWAIVLNCSHCRRILRPRRPQPYPKGTKPHTRAAVESIPVVAGRANGRPLCSKCKRLY